MIPNIYYEFILFCVVLQMKFISHDRETKIIMVHNQDFQDPSSIVGAVDTQKVF